MSEPTGSESIDALIEQVKLDLRAEWVKAVGQAQKDATEALVVAAEAVDQRDEVIANLKEFLEDVIIARKLLPDNTSGIRLDQAIERVYHKTGQLLV